MTGEINRAIKIFKHIRNCMNTVLVLPAGHIHRWVRGHVANMRARSEGHCTRAERLSSRNTQNPRNVLRARAWFQIVHVNKYNMVFQVYQRYDRWPGEPLAEVQPMENPICVEQPEANNATPTIQPGISYSPH